MSDQLEIAIILDVTGSMTGELEGLKISITDLVETIQRSELDVSVRLITYTESEDVCQIKQRRYEPCNLARAITEIADIKLGDGSRANGGDADENSKAAIYSLLLGDGPLRKTIAFLVTDALPHIKQRSSEEAQREIEWFKEKRVSENIYSDCILLFDHVTEQFQGQLVMNVIAYNSASHNMGTSIYGKITNGLFLAPTRRDPMSLSKGMMHVINCSIDEEMNPDMDVLRMFTMFDVSNEQKLNFEPQAGLSQCPVIDLAYAFSSAIQRIQTIIPKRSISITNPADQLRTICLAAEYIYKVRKGEYSSMTGREAARFEIESAIERVRESFKKYPRQAGHFALRIGDIDRLANTSVDATAPFVDATCMLSLCSVSDLLETLSADALEGVQSLETAMELLSGFSLAVRMPFETSKAQSLSAWAFRQAPDCSLSVDRVSLAGFFGLMDTNIEHAGMSDSNVSYNAFIALPEPRDELAEIVYYLASGTQVLNWLTAAALGMKDEYIPNLAPGLTASALYWLISSHSNTLREYQSAHVDRLFNALRLLHHPPCSLENIPNPADEPCKLFAAFISRRIVDLESWKPIFEEYLAFEIQSFRRARSLAPFEDLEDFFFSGSIDGLDRWNIDIEKELHVLEQDHISISTEWKPDVLKHFGVKSFYVGCNKLINAMFKGESLDSVWPNWKDTAMLILLQEKRTDRYTIEKQIESTEPKWLKVPTDTLPALHEVLISSMKKFYAKELQSFKLLRADVARALVIEQAAEILATFLDDEAVTQLSQLQVVVMNCKAKLRRIDTPAVLKSAKLIAEKIPSAVKVLVLGKWTTNPSCELFKFRQELVKLVDESDRTELHAAFMRNACLRDPKEKGTNRHGHSLECQKPALLDFNEEYASARLIGLDKKQRLGRVTEYHRKIRAFIKYAQWAKARVVELRLSEDICSFVIDSIEKCLDASLLPRIRMKLQGHIGLMPSL